MSANLITGNLFKPIYAYQDADYQAGISGNVTSIMPVGSQMALSIEDANTIKADDGVLITKEGRRIHIDAGAIEEWNIPTGTQGTTNYFIIGFHLYTDSNSAEVCETFVEQMESATDTIPEDSFREGATEVYISLGRVVQSGINLDSVTSLVQIAQSFEDVKNAITQLNSDLTRFNTEQTMPVGIYIQIATDSQGAIYSNISGGVASVTAYRIAPKIYALNVTIVPNNASYSTILYRIAFGNNGAQTDKIRILNIDAYLRNATDSNSNASTQIQCTDNVAYIRGNVGNWIPTSWNGTIDLVQVRAILRYSEL